MMQGDANNKGILCEGQRFGERLVEHADERHQEISVEQAGEQHQEVTRASFSR